MAGSQTFNADRLQYSDAVASAVHRGLAVKRSGPFTAAVDVSFGDIGSNLRSAYVMRPMAKARSQLPTLYCGAVR